MTAHALRGFEVRLDMTARNQVAPGAQQAEMNLRGADGGLGGEDGIENGIVTHGSPIATREQTPRRRREARPRALGERRGSFREFFLDASAHQIGVMQA